MASRPTVACLVDSRFPGGTSAAVAAELRALAPFVRLGVHDLGGRMFPGRPTAPVLADALDEIGLVPVTGADRIAADTVVLHNPAFLKFETALAPRILARDLVVVMHENPLRPGGEEAFDLDRCLALVDGAALALRKWLAPVSPANRALVADWLAARPRLSHWRILPRDWHNICDLPLGTPASAPADRRGRHSRPGFEKFPPLEALDLMFPATAEANVILGGDLLATAAASRPHWRVIPFQGIEIPDYFAMIDFMVYFVAPTWRESFGRVLAEGVAAGKVVISDPGTAEAFPGAVIGATPADVSDIVARLVAAPRQYADTVRRAQAGLGRFSADAFIAAHAALFGLTGEAAA